MICSCISWSQWSCAIYSSSFIFTTRQLYANKHAHGIFMKITAENKVLFSQNILKNTKYFRLSKDPTMACTECATCLPTSFLFLSYMALLLMRIKPYMFHTWLGWQAKREKIKIYKNFCLNTRYQASEFSEVLSNSPIWIFMRIWNYEDCWLGEVN